MNTAEDRLVARWPGNLAYGLSLLLMVTVALHGWPVGDSPRGRLLWPANVVLAGWLVVAARALLSPEGRRRILALLPPECVWAYVILCTLSVAVPDQAGRAAVAAVKIVLSFLGAYTLLRVGLRSDRRAAAFLLVSCAVASAVVVHALLQKLSGQPTTALFGSGLKLGTFLAMSIPLAWSHLIDRDRPSTRWWALGLLCGGLMVCESAWAFAGIVSGTVVACLVHRAQARWLAIGIAVSIPLCALLAWSGRMDGLRADARLMEPDGADLRQRYLEWQAQINLLADRSGAGTGVGSLNAYRSEYYGRLPKRNTLAAFDQNGWLATASETGLIGLACLCWVFRDYLGRCVAWRHDRVVRAALAGMVGAAVANVASAIQYGGILVLFVVLLALVDGRTGAEAPGHE